MNCGDTQKLCQRIASQVVEMKAKVLGFEAKYKKCIRSSLASRCLIVTWAIDDPLTVFLHRQTFVISKHNPSYISCFDVMSFESDCKKDDEWEMFRNHLVDRKLYVIEDWNKSFSTIEVLMYDYGLKEPDDGTAAPFYKGECDASYDPKTGIAGLSYIIWKDDKIIHSEVFYHLKCCSAVEAEIYAACALLYKAEELKITKLLVWLDSKTVATILTGELPIGINHPHRDFFLMLRAMRSRFKRLVVTWKPRELMVFVDDLAKTARSSGSDSATSDISKYSTAKWYNHLRGLPVLRTERTPPANKAVNKFRNVKLDESYAVNPDSIYFIEVEEDSKFDCLVGLNQALKPSDLNVFVSNFEDKPDSLKQQLNTGYRKISEYDLGSYMFTYNSTEDSLRSKSLVVAFDYSVPKDIYYQSGSFHVVLVTPSELNNMAERIPELTALGYVYFNEVRLPLNPNEEEEKKKKK